MCRIQKYIIIRYLIIINYRYDVGLGIVVVRWRATRCTGGDHEEHCCCSYLMHMPRLSSGFSSLLPGPNCTLITNGVVLPAGEKTDENKNYYRRELLNKVANAFEGTGSCWSEC